MALAALLRRGRGERRGWGAALGKRGEDALRFYGHAAGLAGGRPGFKLSSGEWRAS